MFNLDQLYQEAQGEEPHFLSDLADPNQNSSFTLLRLKGANEIFFLYEAFIKKNIQASKTFLYKAAMIESYYCEKYNRDVFGAFFTFTFPIISDSEVAIRKYLKYSDTKATNAFTTHFSKGLQSIITNNTADLAIRVAGLHKTGQKGWAKPFIGVAKAFEGFLENNLEKIEDGIKAVLAKHKKDQRAFVGEYTSLAAVTIAKLAIRKGYEINIDHPFLPKELLPIKELDNYEGYDFFKDLVL